MRKKNVYLIGIGGIGMSALARYFNHEGRKVAGYDRTATPLTRQLESEGIAVHYEDSVDAVPDAFKDRENTLVIYTPAIPDDHIEYNYFLENGFEPVKRSRVLGLLTEGKYVMAVAGTHGKTTVTTMTAWFNYVAGGGGSAFLGGISKNFDSNLVLSSGDRLAVEADEFDRSFLQLNPDIAVITAVDADHLDIYGDYDSVIEAFTRFTDRIKPGGSLILRQGIELPLRNDRIRVYRYSYDTPCDFFAENIRPAGGGHSLFDLVCPDRTIKECHTGIPGRINIENSVAATSLVWLTGCDDGKLREAIGSFQGVKRRFDFHINTPELVYMDDYAHHPEEITAALVSLRGMFPGRKITAVFQPHLYTRTRDFSSGFSESLSLADEVILLPIYPARELPIPGVDSGLILEGITSPRILLEKNRVVEHLNNIDTDILVTFGAGDIDTLVLPVKEMLRKKYRIGNES